MLTTNTSTLNKQKHDRITAPTRNWRLAKFGLDGFGRTEAHAANTKIKRNFFKKGFVRLTNSCGFYV